MIDKRVQEFARLKTLPFFYIFKTSFSPFKMPPLPSTKKSCTAINDDIKQQICIYATKSENKNKSQQQIVNYFNQQNENLNIDRSTISKIVKKKDKWLAILSSSNNTKNFHHKEVKYPQIEEALGLWVENANANNLAVSEMIIREKAFFCTRIWDFT